MPASDTSTGKQIAAMSDGSGHRRCGLWRQYLGTIVVNLLSFLGGTAWGWPAPLLPELQSVTSPIATRPLTADEASWMASVLGLSRLVTLPAYVYMNDRFGRKFTSHMVALPFFISWGMLLFADSINMLLWGRLVSGVAAGGAGVLVPAYAADIAEDHIRGRLGVVFGLTMNLGITYSYVVGFYASYMVFHVSLVLLSVVFVLAFHWLPESPIYLMTAGREEEAGASLRWFRDGQDCEVELQRLRLRAEDVLDKRKKKVSLWSMLDRPTTRGLLICLGIMANQLLSGASPVAAYAMAIFQEAGTTLPANVCAILVGVVQTVGNLLSAVLIERSGRRPLLIYSDILVALSLFVLGTHFYLKSLAWDMSSLGWVPILSLCVYIFTLGVALTPLPFTIASEMINIHARGPAQCLILMFLSAGMFTLVLTYTPLTLLAGQHGCFWLYAAVCALSAVCVYFFVPETKNRSLEDVIEQLNSDQYIRSVVHFGKKPQQLSHK